MTATPVRPWLIFFSSASLFVLSQFYRAAVAVITPQLIADVGLDARGLSLLSAAFFYGFAFTQIPLVIYLDRIGSRKIMTVLNLVAVAGAVLFAAAGSLEALAVARLLIGIGMAGNLMGTFKLISLWFEPLRFATLSALVFSMGTVGNIFATSPLVLLAKTVGWRQAFLVVGALNLLLTAGIFLIISDAPGSTSSKGHSHSGSISMGETLSGVRRLFKTKDYWIISLGRFCYYGVYAAIQTLYAGPYLMKAHSLSPVGAGNIILLMNIGFVFGGPLFGWVSDRLSGTRKWLVMPGLTLMALIVAVLASLPTDAATFWLAILFFSLGMAGSTGGIMYAHIKERMPAEYAGTAMTGINFFTMIGPAVFLQGLGSLMQAVYPSAALGAPAFRIAFFLCSGCLLTVACLYLVTDDTRRLRRA